MVNNNEDKEIFDAVKQGNFEAQQVLYKKYFYIAENIAVNRIHNTKYDYPIILRICSKGLMEAIKSYSTFDSDFKTFATTHIGYKIDSFLSNNPKPVLNAYDNNASIIKIIKAFHIKADIQNYIDVRCAIETLPIKVKECIVLLYVSQLKISDVAKALNTSPENIKQAMEKVKELLIRQFGSSKEKWKKFPISIMDHFAGFSIEQIADAINKLPDSQKEQVFKIYGHNLDEYHNPSKTEKENFKKTILKNIIKLINGENIYAKRSNRKSIEKLFPGRTLTEIKQAITHLQASEQSLIYKIYGIDLNEHNSILKEEKSKLRTIKKHLNNYFQFGNVKKIVVKKRNRKGKSLINRYPDISKEKLQEAVIKLPISEQQLIYEMFGENLDEYHFVSNNNYQRFMQTIKKHLDYHLNINNSVKVKRHGLSLLDRFPNASKEALKEAVSKLSSKDQQIVYEMFGKNLEEYHTVNIVDYHRFAKTIKKHLPLLLNANDYAKVNRRGLSLLERFPSTSKVELQEAVKKLTDKDQKIIYEMFGNNLDEFHSVDIKNYQRFKNTISKYLNMALNGEELPKAKVKENKPKKRSLSLLERYPNVTIDMLIEAINKLPDKDQKIIYLLFGDNLSEWHSVNRKDYQKFVKVIKIRIDLIIDDLKKAGLSLLERYPNVPKEYLKMVVKNLPIVEQQLVYTMFGENLDEYHEIDKNGYNRFVMTVNKHLNTYLNNNMTNPTIPLKITIDDKGNIDSSLNSLVLINEKGSINLDFDNIAQSFKSIIESSEFSKEDLLIAFLRVLMLEEPGSIGNISRYFAKTPEEINDITYKIVSSLEDKFIELTSSVKKEVKSSCQKLQ